MTGSDEPVRYARPADLLAAPGCSLGPTGWYRLEQSAIDEFASATGDHQWIHVDPVRAAAGPYGATIAHGYLTLALAGTFVPRLLSVTGASAIVNYGADRTRFLTPVRVGSRLRASGEIASAEPVVGGVQVGLDLVIELEGSSRPACAVRSILRYLD